MHSHTHTKKELQVQCRLILFLKQRKNWRLDKNNNKIIIQCQTCLQNAFNINTS